MQSYSLTVRSIADLLNVSPSTVRRWADMGLLGSYKLPSGHRRFEPGAVLRFRQQLLKPLSEGER